MDDAKREPQIQSQIKSMRVGVGQMRERLAKLEDRLKPVSLPQVPKDEAKETEAEQPKIPLLYDISEISREISRLSDWIMEMIERLEI